MIVSQTHPDKSATFRSRHPDSWMWGLREQLLAATLDELAWQSWTKTKDAGKAKNPAPEPTPRPGVTPKKKAMRIGAVMTPEEFDRRYAQKLARAA